jgi:hypothetical protein
LGSIECKIPSVVIGGIWNPKTPFVSKNIFPSTVIVGKRDPKTDMVFRFISIGCRGVQLISISISIVIDGKRDLKSILCREIIYGRGGGCFWVGHTVQAQSSFSISD